MAKQREKVPGFVRCSAGVSVEFSAEESGGKKLRRFTGVSYTGGIMRPVGFYRDVVLDMEGGKVAHATIPAFLNHDSAKIVGHTESELLAE